MYIRICLTRVGDLANLSGSIRVVPTITYVILRQLGFQMDESTPTESKGCSSAFLDLRIIRMPVSPSCGGLWRTEGQKVGTRSVDDVLEPYIDNTNDIILASKKT